MSAPKKYDRVELLDRAIELFRRQGYNGTSTAELVEELGVNRKSMYAEFGSKQGLFEAALERYSRRHLTFVLGPLEAANAGPATIREAFASYASASEGAFRGRGCLMCNTAAERAALDPASGRYVAAYLERVTLAFRRAVENGQRIGEVDPDANADDLASFFMVAFIGVTACVRAEAPPEQLYAAVRVATDVLDAVKPKRFVAKAAG